VSLKDLPVVESVIVMVHVCVELEHEEVHMMLASIVLPGLTVMVEIGVSNAGRSSYHA